MVIARELENAKRAFIAYSPTRTLDEVSAIHVRRRIKEKATNEGVAVLLVSEDLDEILVISGTVYVMNSGRLYGPLSPQTPTKK